MKKTMVVLLCMVSVLVNAAYGFYQKNEDHKKMECIEETEESISFYVNESNKSAEEELKLFAQLSEEYGASFVRTDRVYEDGRQITRKSGVYTEKYEETFTQELKSGVFPETPEQFVATYETGQKEQCGLLYDLFQDDMVVIGFLEQYYKEYGTETKGAYTLIADAESREKVLGELAFFWGMSREELLTPTSGVMFYTGRGYTLLIFFAVILFLVFCLMNFFYPVSCLKKIGVMRLQGYKYFDIWKALDGGIMWIPIVFYAVSVIIQIVCIRDSGIMYYIGLSGILAGIWFFAFIVSLVMLITVRRFKIGEILKNCFNFRIPLYFCYAMKLLVFIGLIYVMPQIAQELQNLIDIVQVKQIYESEKDYLTLSNYNYVDDEFEDSLSGENRIRTKLVNLYLELENTAECRYIYTSNIYSSLTEEYNTEKWTDVKFEGNENYTYIAANIHELKEWQMELPQSLEELFKEEMLTVLIPESMKSEQEKVEYLVYCMAADYVYASEEEEPQKVEDIPVNIVYYPDNEKRIFSEDIDRINTDHGFVTNPIVFCMNAQCSERSMSFLENSAMYNPIRIKNTPENQEAIRKAIKNQALERNSIQFENVLSTGYADKLQYAQLEFVWGVFLLCIAAAVSVLASYYIVLIILKSERKRILVGRLLGYSMPDRYQDIIFWFLLIYVLGGAEILILSQELNPLMLYMLMVLADASIIFGMIKHQERKTLANALKGVE